MPSIEIICVGQKKALRFRGIPLTVSPEGGVLRSHHHPSRFQPDFERLQGCIYHLGCPHFRGSRRESFECYELLSRKCRDQWPGLLYLEFDRAYASTLGKVLNDLSIRSPVGRVVFTSDYRFSPNHTRRVERMSMLEFWAFHRSKRLHFNTLYSIVSGA